MNDLSPAARELVESHRRDKMLTHADRARIKQKLMLRVSTVGATTAVAGTAAGMSLASKVVLVAVGVAGVAGTSSFSVWALRARAPTHVAPIATSVRGTTDVVGPASDPSATPMVAPAAPGRTPASVPMARPGRTAAALAGAPRRGPAATSIPTVAAAPISSASADSRHRDHVRKIDDRPLASAPESPLAAATPVASPVVLPDPERELRVLREARDDLRAGRPASAYHRLDDFERERGGGMLAQERSALSAIALCRSQPGPDAQARAAGFLRRSPESPLAARVRSACEQARKASP